MTEVQVIIGAFPTAAPITEGATSQRVDLAFEIRNSSDHELDLVAIDQDVRSEDGSLMERRTVGTSMRIAPGDRRTVSNPISELGRRVPVVSLVYTFAFRAPWGGFLHLPVRVAPIRSAALAQLEPAAQPIGDATRADEGAPAPTRRQAARAWSRRSTSSA